MHLLSPHMNLPCRFRLGVVSILAAPAFAIFALSARADVVTDWNSALLQTIRSDLTPPPRASRAMAMTHLAVYDAVVSVTRTHAPYLGYQSVVGPTSIEAAAASAAHRVLSDLYPTQRSTFDALLDSQLASVSDATQRANGVTLGTAAANAMLAARLNDNSTSVVSYTYPTPGTIGAYDRTPNAFANYLLPQWKDVTPFAMTSTTQFRPPGAPAIISAAYTAAYNEVQSLGSASSATRTAEQTQIAIFWADGAGTATPPGHWNLIAQGVSSQQSLSLADTARLFALLNMAAADVSIAAWDAKFVEALWRPVTGIRTDDGNPDTLLDASWTPFLLTPPHPSYVSGHSMFSAAAGGILAEFFGTDAFDFTVVTEDTSNLPVGYTRDYTSFSEAVDEAGMSRIYGGIHWQFDNTDGKASGYALSAYVANNYLQAVPEPSAALLLLSAVPMLLFFCRRRPPPPSC